MEFWYRNNSVLYTGCFYEATNDNQFFLEPGLRLVIKVIIDLYIKYVGLIRYESINDLNAYTTFPQNFQIYFLA